MAGPPGNGGRSRRGTGHCGSGARGRKGQVIGGYLVGEEIGKGAFGRVYKGINQRTGNVVAVKEVSLEGIADEDLRGIMSEIDLLKTLAHKNIVKYLSSAKSSAHLYIMLEFVENGSLSAFIRPSRFGAFPESLVVLYISQVLEGLAYLHEQGVIHRDIKGANILTTKQGLVKLADFGVATRLSAERSKQHVVGTPYWMSPEMIEMKEVTTLSDIWSVGCTVIELLTSEPPYHDLEPMQALYNIVNSERPPLPEGISDLLADFLKQCFQKDQRKRPTARKLLQHSWIEKMQNDLKRSWPRQSGKPSNASARQNAADSSRHSVLGNERNAEQRQQPPAQQEGYDQNGVKTVIQRMLEHEEQQGAQATAASSYESEPAFEYDPEAGKRLASWLHNVESGSAGGNGMPSKAETMRDGTETVTTNATTATSRTATARRVTTSKGDGDFEEPRRLVSQLRPEKRESALTNACEKLAVHAASASETKGMQMALQAAQPLAVLLEHCNLQVQEAALRVVEKLAAAGESPLFYLGLLGLLPPLIKLCATGNPSQIRLPAARTIGYVSGTRRTVEMLIACQATPKLVELFEEDYKGVNIDLAQIGLEVMMNILSLQEVAPVDTDAFMQLLARGKLPDQLSRSLESMSNANEEDVRLSEQGSAYQHMQQACKLLLELSQGRGACVEALCRPEVLSRIVQLLDRVNPEFRLQLLEVIKYLSHHESAMETLEQAGAIQILIPYLYRDIHKGREKSARRSGGAEQIEKQQLASLFALCNICRRKKGRQEKAALAGAVGPLVELSRRGGVYESAIIPVLCGMAQASRRTRGELWRHHVLERLMECLDTDNFRLEALESAVAWLSYEPGKAEPVMLQASQLERLTEVFCSAPPNSLVRVMELMLRLVARASRVAAALARGRLGKRLIQLLHSSDPSVSLMALKMVKALYEVHPAPKELAATLNLQAELQSISASSDAQNAVLAQSLAQQLLSALQVSSFV